MSIFNGNDYNSNNGFQTSVFGPNIWFTLHLISFNYPVKPTSSDKQHYRNWLLSWEYILPCIHCRTNFKKNINELKFSNSTMNSRYTFSYFIYKLHNHINKLLGKKIKISYEEVRDRYENFRSSCGEKKQTHELIKKEKKEIGKKTCDESLYGSKARSVIRIVPKSSKVPSFKIDNKCKRSKKVKK